MSSFEEKRNTYERLVETLTPREVFEEVPAPSGRGPLPEDAPVLA